MNNKKYIDNKINRDLAPLSVALKYVTIIGQFTTKFYIL